MIKSVPVTPELEIIFQGKKNGLDIYKSATNVITIRPGSIHIHNGFANYLFQTTEWETVGMSSGNDSDGVAYTTSWYFVTLDKDGTIRTHAATGTNAVRPSDTAYTWVGNDNTGGFKHNKQAYYYNESERIIGAVYRSTNIDYIINNYDKADEVGESSYGEWRALSDGTQTCRNRELILPDLNGDATYDSWVLPKGFVDTNYTYGCFGADGQQNINIVPWPSSYSATNACRFRTSGDVSTQELNVYATGRWRN